MKAITSEKLKSSTPFCCSIRFGIAFLGFLGMIIHFTQKTNLSIGLVCMVNHSAIEQYEPKFSHKHINNDDCPQTNATKNIEGPFIWSKNTQGIILGAYYWGYIATQIPAGYLAGRFGARFIYSGAIFISSLFTMFMPISAQIHWILLCIVQVIIGLGHGTIWPCLAVIAAHWAPINERGKLMGFINAGGQIGNVLALSMGGLMCSWDLFGGWPLIFYSAGIIGFAWSVIWVIFFTNSPRNHQCISQEEKEYILENTQQHLTTDNKHRFHAPWRAILTSRACWGLFIIHTCANYGTYTFLTSIPKYLNEVLKFNIKSNGLLSATPYIILWFNTNFSGFLADRFVRKKILTITNTRKLFNVLGSILPTIFVIALAFMTCQLKYIAVTLLITGVAFGGFAFGGGFLLVANDMAPAYAGIVFGISNTFATIPGIVSPYVVGSLTEKNPNNWRIVFFICAVVYLIGMISFLVLGSSEVQPWAKKNINNGDAKDTLLLKDNGDTSTKLTSEA